MRVRTAWATMAMMAALISTASAQNDGIELVGSWNQDAGTYADVWGEANLAFLGKFGPSRVLILDISDPAAPTLVSRYQVPPPNNKASAQDVKTAGGLMFIGLERDGNAGAQIVDIRDPSQPSHLVDITINDDTHNLFFADGWLYLTGGGNRFASIDLREFDPDNPPDTITTPTWWVNGVGGRFVHDITVQGDRLYASGWDGIYVFDVSDIANQAPVFLGSAPGVSTHAAWATDDGRWVVTAEERADGGIKLYEVVPSGDGVTVTQRDEFAVTGQTAHNPIVLGERVYCSWYGLGCLIFAIDRDAGRLVQVGEYDTGTAWGVYPLLGPRKILIGDMANGLLVLRHDIVGDTNCDGVIGAFDIEAFLVALFDPEAYPSQYPDCDILLADINDDGAVNAFDIEPFLELLFP